MIERHDAHGYWLEAAGAREARSALSGARAADVVIVGGGYSGLWAAWWMKQMEPGAEVVILESGICGQGPSGRNGGFVENLWAHYPALRREFGDTPALELARAAADAVDWVGAFCAEQEVDARFVRGGHLQVSTAPAWDGDWGEALRDARAAGAGDAIVELSAEEVAARCRSPRFRGAAYYPGFAKVDPARLGYGLRDRLLGAGVPIHEHSAVRRLQVSDGGDVIAETSGGSVRARHAILAMGAAVEGVKPWRSRLTVTSSHVVATEPVPDVIEDIGWKGGESITDSRAMVHYFRTTADDRIVFGWGGGRVAAGARTGGRAEVDPHVAGQVERDLLSFFPGLEGRRITNAWGGPIDVSPAHCPLISLAPGGRVAAVYGFTGNGVGPTCLLGRVNASIALGERNQWTRLPVIDPPSRRVPPEPIRYMGGVAVRKALLSVEEAAEESREPTALAKLVAGLPAKMGVRVGR